MMKFPYGFFWGASLSAHQAEGGNINSDWWKWEQESAQRVKSGPACMHYERYKEDFDLAKSIGHNCARLSVEWCRIEPSRGKFDTEAISHYKDVVAALRQRNIEPVVTLHHFTSPQWFADMGGWSDKRAVRSFLAYAEQIVSELAPYVTYWVTINEPLIYIFYGYILGAWPPNRRSLALALAVRKNMILSHIACHRLIHSLYRQKKLPAPSVSIAHHMPAYVACTNSLRDKFSVSLRKALVDFNILDVLARNKSLDYIGVNYYSRTLVHTQGWRIRDLLIKVCSQDHDTLEKNSMGWEIYPQGLYDVLTALIRYKLPIFILENGICTDDDAQRWEFIRSHLTMVHKAIENGAKVIGYTYWSLLDNFEWDKGFVPRFGLIEVDYRTQARTVRESAKKLAQACLTNSLE